MTGLFRPQRILENFIKGHGTSLGPGLRLLRRHKVLASVAQILIQVGAISSRKRSSQFFSKRRSGSPSGILADGNGGIDNNFGGHVMQTIKSLKSDPNAIEKEAREQLRYARPGEVIYVVPAEAQSNRPQPNSAKK